MLHRSSPHAKGYATFSFPGGETIEYDTLQCVHCGGHWAVQPGSGRTRGWCANCGGPHCGQALCWTCTPLEKMLDIWEGRRKLDAVMVGGF